MGKRANFANLNLQLLFQCCVYIWKFVEFHKKGSICMRAHITINGTLKHVLHACLRIHNVCLSGGSKNEDFSG